MQVIKPQFIDVRLERFPKITAIILTKNKSDYVKRCIDSLLNEKYPNMEILIGDTGSSQHEYNRISQMILPYKDKIFYFDIGKYNYSKNHNEIVKQFVAHNTELLLFVNNDTTILNNVVSQMAYSYQDNENIGTLGVQLTYPEGQIQHQGIFVIKTPDDNFSCGHLGHHTWNFRIDPSVVIGNTCAFMMIKKELFEKIGGFNEDYEWVFQDVELSLKAILEGKTNYCLNSCIVEHPESITRKESKNDNILLQKDLIKLNKFIKQNYSKLKHLIIHQ